MRAEIFERIADVPDAVWDELTATGSITMSRAFWRVIEQSDLNDFQYRHAILFDDRNVPVGATSFYSITTDIAIFAPEPLRKLLNGIRKGFPNFLKWKMLECGTPITITSPPFVKVPAVSDEKVLSCLTALLRDVARREKHLLIIMRDFEADAQGYHRLLKRHGYHWIDSLPNTYLKIRWKTPTQYLQDMRSYYRSKIKKHLSRNLESGVRHVLVDDFADLSDQLCAQWMVVHTHAKEFQREILTPAFYEAFSSQLGTDSKALLFYRGEDLIGHALLLVDGELVRWLYVGRETPGNDGLYLYVAQKVAETAIDLGAKRLEMGLTTYSVKQDLGAEVVPIKMALRATGAVINPFVGLGYKLLNSVPTTHPRQVFKQGGA